MNAPAAIVPPYRHTPLFPLGKDTTAYGKLAGDGVRTEKAMGRDVLVVEREALRALSEAAFTDINHLLRPSHLKQLRSILDDPEASDNDRFVAYDFLKNANIAAGGVLPMCQDTGTAIIMGKKGRLVFTDGDDEAALAQGARDAYLKRNLRYSQLAPISMFEEKNTKSNMPAQVEIYAEGAGTDEAVYKFLFIAKGGGSANKSFLFQATPSILTHDRMIAFLKEKVLTLGTAACPPYHLAIVIGGTSAELTMKTVKLASCRYLDDLPTHGSEDGHAFRDVGMENEVQKLTQSLGVGAQFGGKYFCHDVRVIRLPRHGASLPIGLGVSCSADRQALGKITREGVFLEELEHNPAQYLPDVETSKLGGEVAHIDLRTPMKKILAQLSKHPIRTRLSLTGPMIVARDLAHAKLRERLEGGEGLPDYFKNHPVYYAGPAKTPEGYASGSFGPTTAGRMDSFVDQFQAAGGSMVMLAKGNRSPAVREACKKHGGFYLASIGGSAANLAEHCIKKVDVVEYPDFGMEAIWRIEVENFPAFIVVDDKGNDFFKELNLGEVTNPRRCGNNPLHAQAHQETDMSLIKVTDMAYGRLRAPDLDVMEEFLTRFGMKRTDRTSGALYMRGTDPTHHIHVTEKGDPKFVGFAYYAATEEDLKRVSKSPGASEIEDIDEPGGGKRVRLTEPNGYQIEIVYGIAPAAPIETKRQKLNSGNEPLLRAGELMRLPKGPSHVKRIGHGVLMTPKFDETVRWFRETLGFVCSDDVYVGEQSNLIGSFNRCDRGDTYVDHHVFFCLNHPKTGLNHLSFEVHDIDDVAMGHDYLEQFGKYEHMWGIGRHVLGSQVYDYWADPWGRVHEHWADSDRLNLANGSNLVPAEEALNSQWGEAPPEKFINHASV